MATRDVPLEKKVDMKCMRVSELKNIARMTRRLCILQVFVDSNPVMLTRRGGDTQTD